MEIILSLTGIKKPVILYISTIFLASITVTNTLFLTKMQKTANLSEWEVPSGDYKSSKMIVTVRLKLLGLCQLIDIT